MPILALEAGQARPAYVHAIEGAVEQPGMTISRFSSGEYPMRHLRIGGTEYELREQVIARAYPTDAGSYVFFVETVTPFIIGEGLSVGAAAEDWRWKVHAAFQRLLAKRPFEMDAHDQAQWQSLETLIDVAQYRRTAPIRVRQIGTVEYLRCSFPKAVRWADGGREPITLEAMPAPFAGFRPGQWIEAICERDPLSGRLLRATDVQPISSVHMLSREQQDRYLRELPTGKSLPESDLDWTHAE